MEKPYNTLLQLFNTSQDTNGPVRKRRKVDHNSKKTEIQVEEQDELHDEADLSEPEITDDDEIEDPADVAAEEVEAGDSGDENDSMLFSTQNILTYSNNLRPATDPFETHFSIVDSSSLSLNIKAISSKGWLSHKSELPGRLRLIFSHPDTGGDTVQLPAPIHGLQSLKVCTTR